MRVLTPGEVEQAIAKPGEGVSVPLALVRRLAQCIDHGASAFGRRRPEVQGERAAEEVEVELGEPPATSYEHENFAAISSMIACS